jgi:prolyl-tRNA synthetase
MAAQKNWEWIKKGAPIRIEIGPRDIEKGTVAVARRDQSPKEKQFIESTKFLKEAENILEDIQSSLLHNATTFRDENMISIETMDEFIKFFTPLNSDKPEIHGGFALCHWAGSNEEEEKIAKDYKVTIRCIPNGDKFIEEGKCILTGKPSNKRVIFSKAY